jgi:hypothetical protein
MWLFELFLLSLVGGSIVGLGLHVWDEWQEKAKSKTDQKAEEYLGEGWIEKIKKHSEKNNI